MESSQFLKDNFRQYLLIITIILFSEIFTLLFLFVPSEFLAESLNVLVFYVFFLVYFLATVLVPWLYIFFENDYKKFLYIGLTSSVCFGLILIINFFVFIPIHIVLIFILLKSLMVGLSSLFKSLIALIDKKETIKKTNFNFRSEKIMGFKTKNESINELYKIDIFGSIFYLLLFPLVLVSLTYIYAVVLL